MGAVEKEAAEKGVLRKEALAERSPSLTMEELGLMRKEMREAVRQRNRQPIQLEISDTGSSSDNEVPIPWGRRPARVQVLTERTKNLAVGGKLMAQGLDGGLQVTCGVAGSAGEGFNMSVTEGMARGCQVEDSTELTEPNEATAADFETASGATAAALIAFML